MATTTVGVTMVRDEQDIIGHTVRHMLDEVDFVLVADNLSTDRTREILDEITNETFRLVVVDDAEPGYFQSEKMTGLARRARLEMGADFIVPFDADEWWFSPYGRIKDVLAEQAHGYVFPAPTYDHVMTGLDDETEPNPIHRMEWRRDYPNKLPKTAFRWTPDAVIAQGNHDVYYTEQVPVVSGVLAVHHYPMRSLDQLLRKVRNGAAAYKAGGDLIPNEFGAHWRQWGELLDAHGPSAIEDILKTYYWREAPAEPLMLDGEEQPPLVFDPPRRTW